MKKIPPGLKPELFFAFSLISAFISYDRPVANVIIAGVLPLIFFRNKFKYAASALCIIISLIITFSAVVIYEKRSYSDDFSYQSTRGTVISDTKLNAGNIIFADFRKQNYAGKTGRFAPGYYFADEIYLRASVPMIQSILNFRGEKAEDMYYRTGGKTGLTQAVVLGDKRFLDSVTSDNFIKAGTAHMLAISGLHVGVIISVLFVLLFFLPLKMRMAVCIACALIYIPLSGFKVTVLRAGLAAVMIMGAYIYDRGVKFDKLVLMLAGLFLLVNPQSVSDISFIMSFSAVYGLSRLKYQKENFFLSLLKIGVIATAFTMPPSLYMFGTFNAAGIFNTIIALPFLYLNIISGLVYLALPDIAAQPAVLSEAMLKTAVSACAEYSSFAFTLFKPGILFTAASAVFLIAVSRTKYIYLSALLIFTAYLPLSADSGIYFPSSPRYKGFIDAGAKEIFFKGSYSSFKYEFIPFAASLNISRFEKGRINIYGGQNSYLTIKDYAENFTNICVNSYEGECKIVYLTRSNTLKKSKIDNKKYYLLYKSRYENANIVELKESGNLLYKNGKFEVFE